MKNYIRKLFGFILWIMLILPMAGCIRDDYGDCLDLTLNIRLSSVEQRHLINLQSVSVYLFDEEGYFLERYDATPEWQSDFSYRMKIPVQQEGTYQFVVWTNANQDSYNVTACEKNATRMQDASLEVRCGGDAIVEELPSMLCYGHHAPVEIKRGPPQEIDVQMKRYTSMVKVIVHGLDEGIDHSLEVEYKSRNYRFDEQEEDSSIRTFLPRSLQEPTYELAGDFRLVRLNETRSSYLKITDVNTRSNLMKLNLIDEVLAKYPGVDFKKEFEFVVEITLLHYVPIQIKVNDWIIVDENI